MANVSETLLGKLLHGEFTADGNIVARYILAEILKVQDRQKYALSDREYVKFRHIENLAAAFQWKLEDVGMMRLHGKTFSLQEFIFWLNGLSVFGDETTTMEFACRGFARLCYDYASCNKVYSFSIVAGQKLVEMGFSSNDLKYLSEVTDSQVVSLALATFNREIAEQYVSEGLESELKEHNQERAFDLLIARFTFTYDAAKQQLETA